MNLYEYAKTELALIQAEAENDLMQETINNQILDLVKLFSEQGHSGLTAPYVLNAIQQLMAFRPLKPLTGEDSEWGEVMFDEGNLQQNNRLSTVFRTNYDNSTAYDIEGRIFSIDNGESWYQSFKSRKPITFPYSPPAEPEKIILSDEDEEEGIE